MNALTTVSNKCDAIEMYLPSLSYPSRLSRLPIVCNAYAERCRELPFPLLLIINPQPQLPLSLIGRVLSDKIPPSAARPFDLLFRVGVNLH